jgi:hypothetical protein
MGVVAVIQARAHHSHDRGAEKAAGAEVLFQVLRRFGLLPALEALGVTPGHDDFQLSPVDDLPQPLEVGLLQARQEAGFQGDSVNLEGRGLPEEVLVAHRPRGLLLVPIDLTEIAVVAVAVDPDLHDGCS